MKRIWLWPIVIGVLSLAGLIAGLVSDGMGDWLAWAGLGVPVALSAVLSWRKQPRR